MFQVKNENNYAAASVSARELFLSHDQEAMIRIFSLEADETYLYLNFVSAPYRIRRKTGAEESKRYGGWKEAAFNDVMTIYDMLCNPNGRPALTGRWISVSEMNRLKSGAKTLGSGLNTKWENFYRGKAEQLSAACRALGGRRETVGDVAYTLPVFDWMSVYFQFWDGDEEFLPQIRFLWDEATPDYLHFETTFYATDFILDCLRELVEREETP